MARHDGRSDDALRPVELVPGWLRHTPASVLISMGGTRLLCAASVEDRVPPHLKDTGEGWVTAEYGMIPCSTSPRTPREAARGRPAGRTMEIQRLIARALRSVVDRKALGTRTLTVDCDVLQADGGTRTAGITGGYVALVLALDRLWGEGRLLGPPLTGLVAAVSVGIVAGRALLDLDYAEDSAAEVDMNVVRTDDGRFVEVQGTAEATPFRKTELDAMLELAGRGIDRLQQRQREVLGPALARLRGGA